MKGRLWALYLAIVLLLTGCAPQIKQADETEQIYASFYPIYALSSLVLDEVPGIRLKCLVQPQDDCLRLYDLSDWDASVLAYDADAIIIGGNGLESFENALYTFGDSGPAIITATHGMTLIEQNEGAGADGDTGHLEGVNPHAYMSVAGARDMIKTIKSALIALYPEKSGAIESAAMTADEKLAALREQTAQICKSAAGGRVILMNEALIHAAREYGLDVAYQYDRESGTTLYGDSLEAAVATFRETGASVILIEKHAPTELTGALEDAGFTVVGVDVMSSYSTDSGEKGYFDIQLANAQAIADAFK